MIIAFACNNFLRELKQNYNTRVQSRSATLEAAHGAILLKSVPFCKYQQMSFAHYFAMLLFVMPH
jgi:hypothetical protein